MPAISVLIPIYNVEAYLQRCINSVLSQDFEDYELILVDDGSPDSSGAICDDNENANPDKIKVIHKENAGLISARRAGVLAARGKYLMFLDSDDWLMPGALSALYDAIESNGGYDMVKGGAVRVDDSGKVFPLEPYALEKGEINSTEDFLVKMYTGKIAPYLWGALYKASLFSAETFDESIEKRISLGEDTVTNLIAGMSIQRALYIKDKVYNYFINPTSIMSSSLVGKEYGNRLEAFLHDSVFVHYPILLEWQQAKFAAYCFRNCFIPECGFSEDYDKYVAYLTDDTMSEKVRECIDPKFLRFVGNKALFRAYTFLYRTALRLKNISRQKKKLLK